MTFTPESILGSGSTPEDVHALLTNDSGGFIQAVLDCIPMPVFFKSAAGIYLGCNQAFCETLGLTKEQLIGKTPQQLFPRKQADQYSYHDDLLLASRGKQSYESEVITAAGEVRFVRFHKMTFNNKYGEVAGLLGVFEDLTEQKQLEKKLRRLVELDPLTSIYNRRAIEKKLQDELALAKKYYRSTAIIMIDLDGFKQLNDSSGHLAGDMLLKSISALLLKNLRPTDFVGRYGGDEFIIILPHTNLEQANECAQSLLQAIQQHDFSIPGDEARLGASLGVAASKQPVLMDELIAMADRAMYTAKKNGRNRVALATE